MFAQADYFVQTGVSVSPVWAQTDKLTWVLVAAWYDQNYIDTSTGYITTVSGPVPRARGTTPSPREQAGLQYTPIRALVLTFTYRHEMRIPRNPTDPNSAEFSYNDSIFNAGVKFKF